MSGYEDVLARMRERLEREGDEIVEPEELDEVDAVARYGRCQCGRAYRSRVTWRLGEHGDVMATNDAACPNGHVMGVEWPT